VVLQTTGTTPLFIASQKGHVECVRALLDGGAAIDQARVG
jgi:ankyrin repeat protein